MSNAVVQYADPMRHTSAPIVDSNRKNTYSHVFRILAPSRPTNPATMDRAPPPTTANRADNAAPYPAPPPLVYAAPNSSKKVRFWITGAMADRHAPPKAIEAKQSPMRILGDLSKIMLGA
jgi:hypothetical protein